jgi:hypothetical protein
MINSARKESKKGSLNKPKKDEKSIEGNFNLF